MLDFPDPPEIDLKESDYPELAVKGKKPILLHRLTIRFFNSDFLPIVGTISCFLSHVNLWLECEGILSRTSLWPTMVPPILLRASGLVLPDRKIKEKFKCWVLRTTLSIRGGRLVRERELKM